MTGNDPRLSVRLLTYMAPYADGVPQENWKTYCDEVVGRIWRGKDPAVAARGPDGDVA